MSEREALRNLAAEVGAIVGICEDELRQVAGNTNVACLMRRLDEAQAALADRPEQPVAWRIRWAPDRTTDWIDFAKNPPTGIDREASESRGTFEYAYAAPVARPEPAQRQIRHVYGLYPPSTHIQLQVLGCSGTSEYTDIDVQLPCAPQKPVHPVAHWRHVKRGTTYVTAGQAMAQCSTGPINDGDTTQIYRGTDGWLYVRKVEEFQDGRFERIDAPPSHPAPSEAGAERQAVAALKAWLDCTPGTVGWADLRYDARVIAILGDDRGKAQPYEPETKAPYTAHPVNWPAQPAKGDALQPECEEGHECEAPKLCRERSKCFRK